MTSTQNETALDRMLRLTREKNAALDALRDAPWSLESVGLGNTASAIQQRIRAIENGEA